MDKTIVLPAGRTVDSDVLEEPASSYATITHHADHRRVCFSGSLWPEGDVTDHVRRILSNKERTLDDLGGSMDDVVSMQLFVRDDILSRGTQAAIHEVRAEFFDRPHYPTSTMVGVASLLDDDALVEIEIKAEIPADGWDTDVATGEE